MVWELRLVCEDLSWLFLHVWASVQWKTCSSYFDVTDSSFCQLSCNFQFDVSHKIRSRFQKPCSSFRTQGHSKLVIQVILLSLCKKGKNAWDTEHITTIHNCIKGLEWEFMHASWSDMGTGIGVWGLCWSYLHCWIAVAQLRIRTQVLIMPPFIMPPKSGIMKLKLKLFYITLAVHCLAGGIKWVS